MPMKIEYWVLVGLPLVLMVMGMVEVVEVPIVGAVGVLTRVNFPALAEDVAALVPSPLRLIIINW